MTASFASTGLTATLLLWAFSGPAFDAAATGTRPEKHIAGSSTLPPASQPDSPAIKALLDSAARNLEHGQVEQAGAGVERALRIDPSSATAWHYLAQVRLYQGQYEQAESMAHKSDGLDSGASGLKPYNTALMAVARQASQDPTHARERDQEIFRRQLANETRPQGPGRTQQAGERVVAIPIARDSRQAQTPEPGRLSSDRAQRRADIADRSAVPAQRRSADTSGEIEVAGDRPRAWSTSEYTDGGSYRTEPRRWRQDTDFYSTETVRNRPGTDDRTYSRYCRIRHGAVVCRDIRVGDARDHVRVEEPVRRIYREPVVVYYESAPVYYEPVVRYPEYRPYRIRHRHYDDDYEDE